MPDPNPPTPDTELIDLIGEALRAATPGEWIGLIKPSGKGVGVVGAKSDRGTGKAIAVVQSIPGGAQRVANTKLIGNAPTWLAQLLGALEAAEAALAEAEEKLSGRYIAAMEAAQRIDDLEYENRALRTRISLAIGRIERGEPGAALTGLQAALVNAEMGDEQ